MKLPTPKQREFFESAATAYSKQLTGDTVAQAYLTTRGITPPAAASFRLGVVAEPLVGHEQYRGRLCIPYVTQRGVVNFTFRCLRPHDCKEADCRKYDAPPGDRNLYNVTAIDQAEMAGSQTIHVCEGELDALTLTMCGLPAVGVPGADNWKKHWPICLGDFAEIFVWADGDQAGRAFGFKLEKELGARRVALPRGKDVNSVYTDGGAEALLAFAAA